MNTLVDCDQEYTEPVLSPALRELYDGDLRFPTNPVDRPYVIGNFVSTLDGVVSYKIEGRSGGSAISGSDDADRFVMGLLRASVDAVMVGSGTVRDAGLKHLWIPEFIYPEAKDLYAHYRTTVLSKPAHPLVVIISGSGRLNLDGAIFQTPELRVVIITTESGEDELVQTGASRLGSVQVRALEAPDGSIDPGAMLHLLFSDFGVRALLHEGGPTLFGQFLRRTLVDELFMTLAPQIAGRLARTTRPGLAEGMEFLPDTAPWFQLLSVKQKSNHLYLRYRGTSKR